MEVREGFIVGVFNYCDRWCERCPLTHRCRLFADQAEFEFEFEHGPLTERKAVRDGRKLQETLERLDLDLKEFEGDLRSGSDSGGGLPDDLESATEPDPCVVVNAVALREKLKRVRQSEDPVVRLAMETIEHFMILVPMKMMRALTQVERQKTVGLQSDANGSGKVALLGLEKMKAAWQSLVDTRHVTGEDAEPFLGEIARLTRNIERSLPSVRAFVRPGLDELAEVGWLDADEKRARQ